jgi:hypothetical protein
MEGFMKVLVLALCIGFSLYNKVMAVTTPEELFGRWAPGDVHVKLVNFTEDERTKFLARIDDTIGKLTLDINLVFDDDVSSGGITVSLLDPPHTGLVTNYATSFRVEDIGGSQIYVPVRLAACKIARSTIEQYPESTNGKPIRENVFLNALVHEFIHGLLIRDHTTNYLGKVPTSLMNPYLSASGDLYWGWNDKRAILAKYGYQGKKFVFGEADIGKWCILRYKDNRVSTTFVITDAIMYVPFIKQGRYKVKISSELAI